MSFPVPYAKVLTLLALTAGSAAASSGQAPDQIPTFTSDVSVTRIEAAVLDGEGRPVRGLSAEDFRVWDAGEERAVEVLLAPEDVPLDLVLVLDFSPSVGADWPDVRERIAEFLEALEPRDRVFLLPFNSQIGPGVRERADHPLLRSLVERFPMIGRTRLYDALFEGYAAVEEPVDGRERRRAMVLVTDGADAGSRHSYRDVLMQAWRGGLPLFPVAVGTAAISDRDLDGYRTLGARREVVEEIRTIQEQLGELARVSGGRLISEREIRDGYQRVLALLRAYYVIGYRSPADRGEGWHEVEVRLRDPGDRRVLVQPGYYGSVADPAAALRAQQEGERLLRERRFAEALEAFGRAREGQLEIGFPDFGSGLALEGLGRLEAARASYRAALERNPGLGPAHARLTALAAARGEFELAWDHAVRADLGGEDVDALIDELARRSSEPAGMESLLRRPVIFLVRPEEPRLEEQRILGRAIVALGRAIERRRDVVLTRNAGAATHYLRLLPDRVQSDELQVELEVWSVRDAERVADEDLRVDDPATVDGSERGINATLDQLFERVRRR